jgi:hypothetical protein
MATSRAPLAIVVSILAVCIAGCGSSGSAGAPKGSAAAVTACGPIAEGSSSSTEACAQGYAAAKAGQSQEKACDTVSNKAIVTTENVADCHAGWASADVAGKGTAGSPSAAGMTACGPIGEGSSSSTEACAQGYDAAKAGESEEKACDSVGYKAILSTENIKDCQAGWSAG